MPLYELQCIKCGEVNEYLLKDKTEAADEVCKTCQGHQLTFLITAPGNYTIKGNNGASVRPKKGLLR